MKESETGLMCDNDDDSDNSPDELIKITEEPKDKWDCESILSEYFDCRRLGGVIKKMFNQFFYNVIIVVVVVVAKLQIMRKCVWLERVYKFLDFFVAF